MRRPAEIVLEEQAMGTLTDLTGVFEGIASMRISLIKNQVLRSSQFFSELWNIYSQIRVDQEFRFGRLGRNQEVIDKDLFVVITAEGGFSGDIDQKVMKLMMDTHNPDKQDIIVIGHHGVVQLAQRAVSFKKYFKLPQKDQNINVWPVAQEVQKYRSTTIFYQRYVSLMNQEARRIDLSAAVRERGQIGEKSEDIISEATYIFEPTTFDVVSHLERSMMLITLSQVILESKLAQYASRFRAMSAAHDRSEEAKDDLHMQFNRAKRALKDERLKEIINGLRKASALS